MTLFRLCLLLFCWNFLESCGRKPSKNEAPNSEESKVEKSQKTNLRVVSAFSELPDCTTENQQNFVYFVIASKNFYYCAEDNTPQLLDLKGREGINGRDGNGGADGINGATGASGLNGSIGTHGDAGATGARGDTGASGTPGSTGATGARAGIGNPARGTQIDTQSFTGFSPSVAYANGVFHIAFYRSTGFLNYSTCSNDCVNYYNWTTTTVSSGSVGKYASLAVNTTALYISYWDLGSGDLKYATCTLAADCTLTANWTSTTIDSTGTVGEHTSLTLTSSAIHLSYYDNTNGNLKYATCSLSTDCSNASNWTLATLESTGNVGEFTSILTDSGKIYIAYYDGTNSTLKFGKCTISANCSSASNWTFSVVDNTASVALQHPSLTGSSGTLHIAYHDTNNASLKYAKSTNDGSSWSLATIDTLSGATRGYIPSIVVSDNKLHVINGDSTRKAIRYGTCTSNCATAANWSFVTLQGVFSSLSDLSSSSYTTNRSLVVASDKVHIFASDSYSSAPSLTYLYCPGTCTALANWQ